MPGRAVFLLLSACLSAPLAAQQPSFASGGAQETISGLIDCGAGSRPSAVGEIKTEDGALWTVPAETRFASGPKAFDLYNACAGVKTESSSAFDLDAVPVIDAGGAETLTAYVFADNYFELYINGQLIGVDTVPFTPFNSSVLRFRVDRPFTAAILAVDWEENLGLGSERGRGVDYSPGDAGIAMRIEDANGAPVAITDGTWRAQTFYVSPLSDRACLVVDGARRDSSSCATQGTRTASGLSAAFWPLPNDWQTSAFDDSGWPQAVTFSNDTVGVRNKPAFTNFLDVFDAPDADAQFIWSSNLVLDNLVLLRRRID